MKTLQRTVTLLFLLAAPMVVCQSQHRRDPLSPAEIDKLRDQAQEPNLRLKLFIEFARHRLDAIDKVRSDPKVADIGIATRDGLQDFLNVYDEMNDNIDTFNDQKADIRKALKLISDGDVEFQAKLRALQTLATKGKEDSKKYEFLLQTALDTVDSGAWDHRQLMAEQEEAAKHKKKSSH